MNTYTIDSSDHNGTHISITRDCLCNYDTEHIIADYEREILICTDCGKTRRMLTYHHILTNAQNIDSWLYKTGI